MSTIRSFIAAAIVLSISSVAIPNKASAEQIDGDMACILISSVLQNNGVRALCEYVYLPSQNGHAYNITVLYSSISEIAALGGIYGAVNSADKSVPTRSVGIVVDFSSGSSAAITFANLRKCFRQYPIDSSGNELATCLLSYTYFE